LAPAVGSKTQLLLVVGCIFYKAHPYALSKLIPLAPTSIHVYEATQAAIIFPLLN
jgi:hypothetical protein